MSAKRNEVHPSGQECPRSEASARRHLPAWLAGPATFLFVLYGWLLFRAGSFARICTLTGALGNWTTPAWLPHYLLNLVLFVLPVLLVQTWQKRANNLLAPLAAPLWLRSSIQGLLLLSILLFWERRPLPFIYFQF